LFNLLKKINSFYTNTLNLSSISEETFIKLSATFRSFITDVLGLTEEKTVEQDSLLKLVLEIYKKAKFSRDYQQVDSIRALLKENGIIVKDLKNGVDWSYEE
jgi:cysteinyl-tRNA synthetase